MTHKVVWNSKLFSETRNIKEVDVLLNAPYPEGYVDFRKKYVALDEITVNELPHGIHFGLRDLKPKYKDSLPDMFRIQLGLVIVSGQMHDLLQEFNLGRTRFHEVPLFEYDQKTPFRGRWYLMYMWEDHPTLVLEKSSGLRQVMSGKPIWRSVGGIEFEAVVDPTPAGDLDMWQDSGFRDSLFFSDRLKKAIKASGMNTRWLGFYICPLAAAET